MNKYFFRLFSTLLLLTGLSMPAAAAEKGATDKIIKDGLLVSLQYTLTGDDGKVIESNKGKDPLKYIHGRKQMIPGLERELTGMKVGGEKHVKVKPEDAYGNVNPKAFQEVDKSKLPPNGIKLGAVLAARSPEGQVMPVKVHEIKEKTVVLDMNHPMAGKTLIFDVKVLNIETAPVAQPAKPAAPAQPAKPNPPAKAK